MIEKLIVNNFQSHKNTKLNFGQGVNVIVGSSNQGKSAILRAFFWALYNRPLGTDDIASHWIRNEQGKKGPALTGEMAVSIKNSRGRLTRARNANSNYYLINDDDALEAVKSDVPEQVKDYFRLSAVNIQQQQDPPFLLSLSSGDVAKFFNQIVRLDVIDRVLSNAETTRRQTNQNIKTVELEIKSFEKELENYKDIDALQEQADKVFNAHERLHGVSGYYTIKYALDEDIETYRGNLEIIKVRDKLNPCHDVIARLLGAEHDLEAFENIRDERKQEIADYKINKKWNRIYNDTNSGMKRIDEIRQVWSIVRDYERDLREVKSDIDSFKQAKEHSTLFDDTAKDVKKTLARLDDLKIDYDARDNLEEELNEYKEQLDIIAVMKIDIERFKQQLPDICPVCGQSMKECVE